MNEEQRLLQILAAIENRNNHSSSSTRVVKPIVIPKIKAKLKSVIDPSKRRSKNATISQDNRDRDYAKLQKAQREWDALVAKAKLDYAMDNALLRTSNIRPINGLYSPELGDFAGWETVGAMSGGTDPLNFIPFGKIANGIRARRLASAMNKVVDEGIVGATAEMPVVRAKDIVNPEHFRYAYNNEVVVPQPISIEDPNRLLTSRPSYVADAPEMHYTGRIPTNLVDYEKIQDLQNARKTVQDIANDPTNYTFLEIQLAHQTLKDAQQFLGTLPIVQQSSGNVIEQGGQSFRDHLKKI